MAKTQKMVRKNSVDIDANEKLLTNNIQFVSESGTFEILADELVGIGGESQVYKAIRQSDGETVLAKIYTEFSYGGKASQDREAVLNLLMKSSDYKKTHLIPLYAAGDIVFDNDVKRPVDIIPNCPDGHLIQCSYEELKNKVIPGVLTALNYLHESDLVHRDIKPENIYLFNDEIVIGDFGTAGRTSSGVGVTNVRRGTVGYTAPEVGGGYFVVSSDYFSFGCTIATLYKGEHVYSHLVENFREGEFIYTVKQNGLPLDCHSQQEHLQILVDALTLIDSDKRAGFHDVKLWLDNVSEFCNRWGNCRSESLHFEYSFEKKTYRTKEELTKAFLDKWEIAKGDFYRGGVKNSKFLNFLVQSNQKCVDDVFKILEEYDKDKTGKYDLDLGFAKLLHYFNSDYSDNSDENRCPIYWCGYEFNTLADISLEMAKDTKNKGVYIRLLGSRFLSWKLHITDSYKNESSIEVIEKIESISLEYPNLAYYLLMYRLAPKESFRSETPDEVFERIVSSGKTIFNTYTDIDILLQDDEYLAKLVADGYEDQVLAFKRNLANDPITNMTNLYRFFESICSNKIVVREHFCKFGPYSHLFWLQQNLELYSFNSDSAIKNSQRIKSVNISSQASIDDLLRNTFTLKEYVKNLRDDFQDDIVLSCMGIDNGKAITAKNMDAYFVNDSFGNEVPVGFLRYLGTNEFKDEEVLKKDENKDEHEEDTTVEDNNQNKGTSYEVTIKSISGNIDEVIRIIRYFTGIDRDLIASSLSNLPCVIGNNLYEQQAKDYLKALQEAEVQADISFR